MEESLERACEEAEVNLPSDARVYAVGYNSKDTKTQEDNPNASLSGCIRCHTPCQNRPCICYR